MPPFSSVMELSENIKAYWEAQSSGAPIPHMELLSVAEVSKQIEISEANAQMALTQAGFQVENTELTLERRSRGCRVEADEMPDQRFAPAWIEFFTDAG